MCTRHTIFAEELCMSCPSVIHRYVEKRKVLQIVLLKRDK